MSKQHSTQFILAVGDLEHGFALHGPFAAADAAEDAGLNSWPDEQRAVLPLTPIDADASAHGDGFADETTAAADALSALVELVSAGPLSLGAQASALRAAIAARPALQDYLRAHHQPDTPKREEESE